MSDDAIIATVDSVRTRSTTQEALITFAVPLEYSAKIATFFTKVGYQVALAFADVNGSVAIKPSKKKAKDKKPFGEQAAELKLSGFFRRPEVWRAIGTDDAFRAWIQLQPSAYSGDQDWVEQIGEGRCEAAHVSRIEYGRGVGHKPEYACIPLTHAEHMLSHGPESEAALGGREWFERMRIEHVEKWAWDTLRAKLGHDSMGSVPPRDLYQWALKFNVEQYLPQSYRRAETAGG